MTNFTYLSHSPSETLKIAKHIASNLQKGHVIILTGELGAGKTKFTEGVLSYYGLENEISSPTFTIVNEYHKKDVSLFHFDVYRLEDSEEFLAIGGEEYFEKGICFLEWGETILDVLPSTYLQIHFEKDPCNETIRILNFHAIGKQYETLLNQISQMEGDLF